jgi:hypothetical protein
MYITAHKFLSQFVDTIDSAREITIRPDVERHDVTMKIGPDGIELRKFHDYNQKDVVVTIPFDSMIATKTEEYY